MAINFLKVAVCGCTQVERASNWRLCITRFVTCSYPFSNYSERSNVFLPESVACINHLVWSMVADTTFDD